MPALALVLAAALGQVISEEPPPPTQAAPQVWRSSRGLLSFSGGVALWPGLERLGRLAPPPGWGPFASAGFALQAGYFHNAFYFAGAELLVGARGGLIVTRGGDPDAVPLDAAGKPSPDLRLVATELEVTADLRVQRAAGPLRPFASLGAGVHSLSVATERGDFVSVQEKEYLKSTSPVVWAGVGLDYRFGPPELCWGFFAEARARALNVGSAAALAAGARSLHGPSYTFNLGVLVGVGH